jgi:hypothetical protein
MTMMMIMVTVTVMMLLAGDLMEMMPGEEEDQAS